MRASPSGNAMFRIFSFDFLRLSMRRQRSERVVGPAKIADGDTLFVGGETIRLHGIDAPELDQIVWWNGEQVACGMMSMAALEALTAGMDIRCEGIDRDRFGRLVAKCFLPNGTDVGERLVASGWALAYRNYSTDYVDAETEARKAERGMWRGIFDKPWEWRASNGSADTSATVAASERSKPRAQTSANAFSGGATDKLARRPATRAQLAFAEKIARAKGIVLPNNAKVSAAAISDWIKANNNAALNDPAGTAPNEQRRQGMTNHMAQRHEDGAVDAARIQDDPTSDRETPLKIPYGNKEEAMRLGARYRKPGGWYAPPGINLGEFARRGWL